MIIPDPQKKTVKIPVRIVDGKAEYFYGGPFPKLNNAIGDLVVPAFSLAEPPFAQECSETERSDILPEGASLMMNVWADSSAPGVVRNILSGPQPGNIEVRLLEPLHLCHRGTKSSVLASCRCFVPALDEEASSLNHAYTIISKKYETNRRSNTGNVFLKAYFPVKGNLWVPLQGLREIHDAEFERRFTANRVGQQTQALHFRDSNAIERAELRDADGRRLFASTDATGLTIEEQTNRSSQTIRTHSPYAVLFELLRDRFATSADLENWLASKGISLDFRSDFPADTEDDDQLFPVITLGSRILPARGSSGSQARHDSPDPKESIQADFDPEERFVEVDATNFAQIDKYFADGWIRVKNVFARQPLVPTETKPLLNIPARIRLADFRLSKHQRRIIRRNSDLRSEIEAHSITLEDFELFERHKERFALDPSYTIHNVVPISSLTTIMKITVRNDDGLLAASFLDTGPNSAYSIYGIFEPTIESRSLGILTMLKEIEFSIAQGKEFYYLGYVFGFPSIYDYKKQFHGLELFDWRGNWTSRGRSGETRNGA